MKRPKHISAKERAEYAAEARAHYGNEPLPLDDDTRARLALTAQCMGRGDAERGDARRVLGGELALFQASYDEAFEAATALRRAV